MMKVKPILLITLVILVDLITHRIPVQAQLIPSLQVATDPPPKPPSRGTPTDRREPAGTRGPCDETNKPFTPLLPVGDSGFSGFTLAEYPTFWFFIPYKVSSVSSGKFVLEDGEGNLIYRIAFHLPETPGFVSISLPTTEQPLEKNKPYSWTVVLNCASQDSEQPNFVTHTGMIERVDRDNIETLLKTVPLTERINLYIDNQIWYDASSELMQIREVPQAWRNLLKGMGLEQLQQDAIAGSVVPIEK